MIQEGTFGQGGMIIASKEDKETLDLKAPTGRRKA
jgi:hypothetical protein